MSNFIENLKRNKIEVIIHFINLVFWFFSVGGIGKFPYSEAKYLSLFIFILVCTFLLSVAILVLIGKNRYTTTHREVANHFITMIIIILLIGTQKAYGVGCLSAEKCQTRAKVLAFGVSLQFISLFSLIIYNTRYSKPTSGYVDQIDDQPDPKEESDHHSVGVFVDEKSQPETKSESESESETGPDHF
ncbi:hypothetical protein M0812_15190 [Anaeramoeba flamelloides]|uniref:MARVEL domain-containing protein n=1 Tax=Anaeramoeba flamelloides TaxID=1746091 RepID=A0AAV7ZBQ1_9EUKA|nr:hypothetical protein M0812_15190 [Anaeramoeba flamelloides]